MLIPMPLFPLSFVSLIAYVFICFYFPLLFLRCSVCHHSYSKSKATWAMVLLTALSLWTAIKGGPHQSHNTVTMQPSAPLKVWGGLSNPREKKHIPYSAVFILIYLLLSCLGVWGFFLIFLVKFYTPEKKISPIETTTTKKYHGHVLLSNEHVLVGLELYWTLFLFLPLQLDNSDLLFFFLLVQSLWNNAFWTNFQNVTVFY